MPRSPRSASKIALPPCVHRDERCFGTPSPSAIVPRHTISLPVATKEFEIRAIAGVTHGGAGVSKNPRRLLPAVH